MVERRLPSGRWYVVAAMLLVASAVVASLAMFMSFRDVAFLRAEFPGTIQCDVDRPGEWVVCIETTDGSTPHSVPMELGVLDDSGHLLPLQELDRAFSYTFGSIRGLGLGRITLEPGVHTFEGRLPAGLGDVDQSWRFAVGPNPVQRMSFTMMIGGSIAVVLFSLGIGTWLLVFWARWKNRAHL
ncbi:MAG: hypothetical protein MK095_03910 [Phycisphaerales bacterium]|nr:hypothetical protein [Phycisphaerales bacterium]